MPHDPVQDHIFGDPDEAPHVPASTGPRRRVPFAGVFGAHDAVRDIDTHPLPRRDESGHRV